MVWGLGFLRLEFKVQGSGFRRLGMDRIRNLMLTPVATGKGGAGARGGQGKRWQGTGGAGEAGGGGGAGGGQWGGGRGRGRGCWGLQLPLVLANVAYAGYPFQAKKGAHVWL